MMWWRWWWETVEAIVVEGREHGGGGTVLKSEEVVSADAVAAAVDLGEQRSLEARASCRSSKRPCCRRRWLRFARGGSRRSPRRTEKEEQ